MAEGINLGTAVARIITDLASLRRDRSVVIRETRVMAEGFNQVGKSADDNAKRASTAIARIAQSFRNAKAEADRFANSDLGRIQSGLKDILGKFTLISAAAGAFVVAGVAAAKQVQGINAMFRILSGSQELANERMDNLRKFADKTKQSFVSVAEGALAILPAVGRNNVSLEKTLSLVQRLSVLDPAQGVQGAAFAVRELLGGDTKSLAGRFELPRKELKKILDMAEGSPQKILDGLDKMVAGFGLTAEAMEGMGQSGAFAFDRVKGAITEALATAFMPLLNNVILPLAEGIAKFVANLNETNPGLLQMIGTVALAVAAFAPLLLIVTQLIGLFGTLKAAAVALNLTSGIGALKGLAASKGVVGAGALTAGAFIGDQIIQNIDTKDKGLQGRLKSVGSGTEDIERIQSGETNVVLNTLQRFGQGLIMAVNFLLEAFREIIRVFGYGANIIKQLFELVGASFNQGIAVIVAVFAELQRAIGSVLVGLADNLSGLFDTTQLREAGKGTLGSADVNAGKAADLMEDSKARLARGLDFNELQQAGNEAAQGIENVRVSIVGALVDLSGMRPPKTGLDALNSTIDGFKLIIAKTNEFAAQFQAAVTPFKPEFSEEQLEEFKTFQQGIAEIQAKGQEQRKQQIADHEEALSELTSRRGLRDRRDIEDETRRQGQARKALDDQLKSIDEQAQANSKAAVEERTERTKEIEEKFNEDRLSREERFQQDRLKAERDHQLKLIEAGSKLDAVSIANEIRSFNEKAQVDQEKLDEETQRAEEQREKDLAILDQSLNDRAVREALFAEAQKAEAILRFNEQQAMEAENRKLRMQRQAEDDALELVAMEKGQAKRLAAIDTATAKEQAALEKTFIETFNKLAADANQHQNTMIGIQRGGQAQLEADMMRFWETQKRLAGEALHINEVQGLLGAPSTGTKGGVIRRTNTTSSTSGGGGIRKRIMTAFQHGTSMIRETGGYQLERGEAVLRPDIASQISRMMGGGINQEALVAAAAGAMGGRGGGASIRIDNMPVFVGDIGNRTNREVEQLTRGALRQELVRFFKDVK